MPVDLPNVYSRTGGVLLGQRSQDRQNYRVTELQGWCRKLGMYVNPRPKFMCPNAELLIRPCEVLSRVANSAILEVANNPFRVLLQHRHMIVRGLA